VPENEAKEHARVPRCFALPCASPLRPARAETRPPISGLRQSARFCPSATSMLGEGQRETKNHTVKNRFSSPFQGGYLRPPALRERPKSGYFMKSFLPMLQI